MVYWVKAVKVAGCPYDLFYPWIAEFDYLPGLHIDKMIVLTALIGPFELSDIFSKLVLYHQAAVEKKLDCII